MRWVKLSALKDYTIDGALIRKAHQALLDKAAAQLLDNKISHCTEGLLTLQTLEKHIEKCILFKNKKVEDILGAHPLTYVGMEGQQYTKTLEKIARAYTECYKAEKFFNIEAIQACIKPKDSQLMSGIGFLSQKKDVIQIPEGKAEPEVTFKVF